jgi:Ni/Fe-hydrogenase subunit HybB-like protein
MVSVGLSALCVAVYLFLVKKFPILAVGEKHA